VIEARTHPNSYIAFLAAVLLSVVISGLARASSTEAPYVPSPVGVAGEQASVARAIGPGGRVVGSTLATGAGWHAFAWTSGGGFVDLGVLGEPYVNTFAVDVNAGGEVVGTATTAGSSDLQRGFFWSQATGMIDLGTVASDTIVEPDAINAAGQVAGTSWASGGQSHAFSWTRSSGTIDIGSLGGTGVRANDLNDSGQIVGISGRGRATPPGPHAFVWSASNGMRDLGTLGGTASEAVSINERGDVVGWAMTTSQQTHAFLWTSSGGMLDLGTLGGSESRPVRISDRGLVIGTSTTATGAVHAFSWTRAGGLVDLGTAGGASSVPTAVNASGQIVGYGMRASGVERPLLWESGTLVDLGSLKAPQGRALAINDGGEIGGYSHTGSGGSPKALVWRHAAVKPIIGSPTASPSAPVAGRRFSVSFPITRTDTRARLTTGTLKSQATVAGRRIACTQVFKDGTARVALIVPKAGKGRLLEVKVTVALDASSAARTAKYRIR
jgi:probable HAF family extracellular repeat protein